MEYISDTSVIWIKISHLDASGISTRPVLDRNRTPMASSLNDAFMASIQTHGSCVKSILFRISSSFVPSDRRSVYHFAASNTGFDHGCIILAKLVCLDKSLDQYPVWIKACLAPSGLIGKFMVRNTSRTSNSNSPGAVIDS